MTVEGSGPAGGIGAAGLTPAQRRVIDNLLTDPADLSWLAGAGSRTSFSVRDVPGGCILSTQRR